MLPLYVIKMGKVSIFLHRSVQNHLDHLAENILGLSRSETIETMIRYVFDRGLKSEVFEHENYAEKLKAFDEKVKEYEKVMAPIWAETEEKGDEENGEFKSLDVRASEEV